MATQNDKLVLELNIGTITIDLLSDLAPKHVEQIKTLVNQDAYDYIVFHRVIDQFVAQTGDVQFGKRGEVNPQQLGMGGSELPDIPAEFGGKHVRGSVSMARSHDPNSANSQFFICLTDLPYLDDKYSVFGKVSSGLEIVDKIKKGNPQSGQVEDPDYIVKAYLESTVAA